MGAEASKNLPEFILFGDSLTTWSFDELTKGYGLHLERMYAGKVRIVNEGFQAAAHKQVAHSRTPSRSTEMTNSKQLSEIVLFCASMTEWSFDEKTRGLGWYLERMYASKANVLNEGQAGYTSSALKHDFDRIITRATHPSTPPTLLFTIFLGANDAAIINGQDAYVPWPTFAVNIRAFIETILTQEDGMSETKIVVITPPPINIPEALMGGGGGVGEKDEEDVEEVNAWKKEGPRYKTYMSKKRYAEGLMDIAHEYAETERVIGVDFWKGIVEEKIKEDGEKTWQEIEESGMWPGSGLIGAKSFDKGWFTDGLHLDRKGYAVLNRMVEESVLGKWPVLAPEKLEIPVDHEHE
ncbi:hypothetical protein EK21DRAFT_74301 [Setomelanomma holmii]|uniref:SGNH hydrolase-type esterase domain-containing protein n=1 Tax=Setomelanomma holmii TaxID=210430 RepID=A0A9P4H103_9PLEO|nr:hypothetical protein EK21DRAFT_74301 [Setomelanomma holmii]